ncbi:MAG: sulfatase [Bacteroidota bacterium]
MCNNFTKLFITCFLLGVINLSWGQDKTGNSSPAPEKPNVLIFLVDDMGLMDTSVPFLTGENGQPKEYPFNRYYKTPGMEKLAERGIRFETFYANSVCSPSRVSLMTGQSSARHGTTTWINPIKKNEGPAEWCWEGLNSKNVTLPRILQSNGYRTIHVGKAHFGPVGSQGEEPTNLGFDVNVAGSSIGRPADYSGLNNYGTGLRHVQDLEIYHGTDTHLSDALTLEMCRKIDNAVEDKKPFFAYMAHYAVHSPFQPDPRFAGQYHDDLGDKMPAFASLIAGMDKSLGDLLGHLESIDQAENTLVIFMGDNGSDAPVNKHQHDIVSSAPIRGKKGAHYEGGMRVPFIVAWAKVNPENKFQKQFQIAQNAITTKAFATIEDIMPTVLELTGANIPDNHKMDGKSILPALKAADTPTGRKHFLMHFPHQHRSNNFTVYREGNWKIIRHYNNQGESAFELFNLENDLTESNNLAKSDSKKLEEMKKTMQAELDNAGALFMGKN